MTTYTIEVRIPEDTANELVHRAVNGSTLTMSGQISMSGFSLNSDISAQVSAGKVMFLDPPEPLQVQLDDFGARGEVKLTGLTFNADNFLQGISPAIAAAVRALNLPSISIAATDLGTIPYAGLASVRCQPRGEVTPSRVNVVVDVALPPVAMDVGPMGGVVATSINKAIWNVVRPALDLAPLLTPAQKDQLTNVIAGNAVSAWNAAWVLLGPALNQAINELLARLQVWIRQGRLRRLVYPITLFSMDAKIAVSRRVINVPAITVQVLSTPKVELVYVGGGTIPGAVVQIKGVEIGIAQHLMTVTLTLS